MGRTKTICAVATCVVSAIAGCSWMPGSHENSAADPPSLSETASAEVLRTHAAYVTSNGFHTGLIVRANDVSRDDWPEIDEIPPHPWVEVGWGSEVFYRAETITPVVVLKAIVPNSSVLHVVGWDPPPELASGGDVVRIELDEQEWTALCRHIHDSYHRDEMGDVENLGRGIYGDGAFFRARGRYYFPNTCNVWTARGLKKAGVRIAPELCGAADAVLLAARRAGTTLRRR